LPPVAACRPQPSSVWATTPGSTSPLPAPAPGSVAVFLLPPQADEAGEHEERGCAHAVL
jgi:hypothetical protein